MGFLVFSFPVSRRAKDMFGESMRWTEAGLVTMRQAPQQGQRELRKVASKPLATTPAATSLADTRQILARPASQPHSQRREDPTAQGMGG